MLSLKSAAFVVSAAMVALSASAAHGEATVRDRDMASDPVGHAMTQAAASAEYAARMDHFLRAHGVHHPQPALDLSIKSPVERARAILTTGAAGGRSPAEWVQATSAEALLLDASVEAVPIESAIAHLARATHSGSDRIDDATLAAMSPAARHDLASLVEVIAQAADTQAPVTDRIARSAVDASNKFDLIPSDEDQEITRSTALRLAHGLGTFAHAGTGASLPAGPLDALGLVWIGSSDDDEYTSTSPASSAVLLIEPGGNDHYLAPTAVACAPVPEIVIEDCGSRSVAILLDESGNDACNYTGSPTLAQGAGALGGIGILADLDGDDAYRVDLIGNGEIGSLVTPGAQGFGVAGGAGLLIDATGDDEYVSVVETVSTTGMTNNAQGASQTGGFGVASDGNGDDAWLVVAQGPSPMHSGMDVYTNGAAIASGVAINVDTGGGNDRYFAYDHADKTDYYSQGFGAFGGLGILYDDGGDDDYVADEAQGAGGFIPLLNCAFGTGSFAGLGIMIDAGGNDRYEARTTSPYQAITAMEGYGGPGAAGGLFVDVSGDDGHFAYVSGAPGSETAGRGVLVVGNLNDPVLLALQPGGNVGGTFLDLQGSDTYVGAPPSRENAVWVAGADLPTAPAGMLLPAWRVSG